MRIALDVDGVLADFTRATIAWVWSQLGIRLNYDELVRYDIDSYIPEDQRHRLHAAWNAEHFCAMIPPIETSVWTTEGILKTFRKEHTVRVITSPMKTSLHWIAERSAWLKNLFGFEHTDVIYSHAKHEHADEFDVLIDDKYENCRDWMLKTGKPAILVNQPWNRDKHFPYRADDLADAWYMLEKLAPKNLP